MSHLLHLVIQIFFIVVPIVSLLIMPLLVSYGIKHAKPDQTWFSRIFNFNLDILILFFILTILYFSFLYGYKRVFDYDSNFYEWGFNPPVVFSTITFLVMSFGTLVVKIIRAESLVIKFGSLFLMLPCFFITYHLFLILVDIEPVFPVVTFESPDHQHALIYYELPTRDIKFYGLHPKNDFQIKQVSLHCPDSRFVRWIDDQHFLMDVETVGHGFQKLQFSVSQPNICPLNQPD